MAKPLHYTGQRQEDSLDLYFYNARWYDPELGRFAQADTVLPNPGDAKAFDRFAYVNNNPIRILDPSGNIPKECQPGDANCENVGPPPCLKTEEMIRLWYLLVISNPEMAANFYDVDEVILGEGGPKTVFTYDDNGNLTNITVYLSHEPLENDVIDDIELVGEMAHEAYHVGQPYGNQNSLLEEYEAYQVQRETEWDLGKELGLNLDISGLIIQVGKSNPYDEASLFFWFLNNNKIKYWFKNLPLYPPDFVIPNEDLDPVLNP